MAKRSKKPRDVNLLAKAVVDEATSEAEPDEPNPKAEAGRLGGLKGGKTRAKRLSAEERSRIARRAAEARWRKKT